MAVLTEDERDVDACVLGTGLTESLIAAALARREKRVLHLDRLHSYGGNWRALSLSDFLRWANGEEDAELAGCFEEAAAPDRDLSGLTVVDLEAARPSSCFRCRRATWDPFGAKSEEERQALQGLLLRSSNGFNLDLVPRLLFGRSDLVDALVESGVARYLEFQGLKSARVLTSAGLKSVPMTKSEIFQDPVLTLPEKRTLMRFITSMMPFVGSLAFESPAQLGVDQARQVRGPSDPVSSAPEGVDLAEPWPQFMKRQKLSPRLQEFVTYAICLCEWAQLDSEASRIGGKELCTGEGLERLGRFVSSLGMHGRGTGMPLLYPMYGAAEIAQGYTRMCALHRGVYALRTSVTKLLARKDDDTSAWQVAGVVTNRGEVIRARAVIAAPDYLMQPLPPSAKSASAAESSAAEAAESGAEASADAAPSDAGTSARLDFEPPARAAADSPSVAGGPASGEGATICKRMTVVTDCPLLAEDGLNLCVVPPSALEPQLANVVQVLQLDSTTGTCPRGYSVLHLSQVSRESATDLEDSLFGDLQRVLESLLSHSGGSEHCLFRCVYLHAPRSSDVSGFSQTAAEVLGGCLAGRSLAACSDPTAMPQLLADQEVVEARDIFLQSALHKGKALRPEDFLEKPEHVALEEKSTAFEELEAFNEQMAGAERAPAAATASAALEAAATDTAAPEAAGGSHPAEAVADPTPDAAEAAPELSSQSTPGAAMEPPPLAETGTESVVEETPANSKEEVEAAAEDAQ